MLKGLLAEHHFPHSNILSLFLLGMKAWRRDKNNFKAIKYIFITVSTFEYFIYHAEQKNGTRENENVRKEGEESHHLHMAQAKIYKNITAMSCCFNLDGNVE